MNRVTKLRRTGMHLAIPAAMTVIPPSTVLGRARFAGLLALITVWFVSSADAQSRARGFSGLYAGTDAGLQQVIGGSLVDGVDTLQEDTRLVVTVFAGLRARFSGFVVGGELGYGRTDGDLVLSEPSRPLTVDYANDSQWNWTLTGGHTVGSRTLLFGYLSEVTREFEVTIRLDGRASMQHDEQGLLRFGAGIEPQLAGPLRLRATAGSSRADFGGRGHQHRTRQAVRSGCRARDSVLLAQGDAAAGLGVQIRHD